MNYHWLKSGKSESLMLDRLLYYLSVKIQWLDFKWVSVVGVCGKSTNHWGMLRIVDSGSVCGKSTNHWGVLEIVGWGSVGGGCVWEVRWPSEVLGIMGSGSVGGGCVCGKPTDQQGVGNCRLSRCHRRVAWHHHHAVAWRHHCPVSLGWPDVTVVTGPLGLGFALFCGPWASCGTLGFTWV